MTIQASFMRFVLASGAAVLLIAGTAGAALAKSQPDVKVIGHLPSAEIQTERVSFADLNLASPGGVRRLNDRIGGAVSRVCFAFDYVKSSIKADCDEAAWNGARPQMDRAIMRARQIASTGTSSIPPVAIAIVLAH
jgi:UrcA family protein